MFDTKLTAHLAALSKLEFTKEELARITEEMDSIVALMDTVSDFNDTSEQEITSPVSLSELRADKPTDSMEREAALKNAKNKSETFFKVPKVV